METRRLEYPRPDFVRASYINLNGTWKFEFDDADQGVSEKWFESHNYSGSIQVPFAYQAPLSRINDQTFHDILWYETETEVSAGADEDVLLHFGAVDYIADVYINGSHACTHEGGDTPFTVTISDYVRDGMAKISVRAFDPCEDETIPRGKQFWMERAAGIWYTPTSGIWQTVWMEKVAKRRIETVRFISRFDEGMEEMRIYLHGDPKDLRLQTRVLLDGELFYENESGTLHAENKVIADLVQNHIFRTNFHNSGISWTPEQPNLFDVELTLKDGQGKVLDSVRSYFGFRKVHTESGMVYLNNKPYYQKLVLDQGYWPDGLLTPPSDEAIRFDIEAGKRLGFNGARKHQKAEDPRFLYWADKLGYLVWGEVSSAPTFGEVQVRRGMRLWSEIVERDYNHPSVIAWVPLNESWGVPGIHADRQQQHYSQALYHFLHSIDPTRLVISNDGWEATETDILAIHNYEHGNDPDSLKAADFEAMLLDRSQIFNRPCGVWDALAQKFEDKGAPIVLSEFGGIGFDVSSGKGDAWGYTTANTAEQFVKEYARVLAAVMASPYLAGFCYTQLTDVMQEINGLLTYDRTFKCDPEKISEINNQYRRCRVET